MTSTKNVADEKIKKTQNFSIEIRPDSLVSVYKFRLRKSPSEGSYILVKEGSAILGFLKSGQNLEIDYYPSSSTESSHKLKTKISYIMSNSRDALKGTT